MIVSNEKVLHGVRLQKEDMILTTNRIILRSLPSRHIDVVMVEWVFAPALSPPRQEPFSNIDPKTITQSIPYSEVSEVKIDCSSESFYKEGEGTVSFYRKGAEDPFLSLAAKQDVFAPLWWTISTVLNDKVLFLSKEAAENVWKLVSKLKRVRLIDLCTFLSEIGFQAQPFGISGESTTGIIELGQSNANFIVKAKFYSDVYFLNFVVSNIKGEVKALDLETQKKGELTRIGWKCADKRLAEMLNLDSSLMQVLLNMKTNKKFKDWRITTSNVRKKGKPTGGGKFKVENFVEIDNWYLEYLPPKEFFEAMDKIAYYIRDVATV